LREATSPPKAPDACERRRDLNFMAEFRFDGLSDSCKDGSRRIKRDRLRCDEGGLRDRLGNVEGDGRRVDGRAMVSDRPKRRLLDWIYS